MIRPTPSFLFYLSIWTLLFFPSSSHGAGKNTIEGKILVHSSPEKNISPGEIPVFLHHHEKTKPFTLRTFTDKNGSFTFDQLAFKKNTSYYVTTEYKDITYGSKMIRFEEENEKKKTIIKVYQSTMKKNVIFASERIITIQVNSKEKKFIIHESIKLKNNSEKIYAGARPLQHNKKEAFKTILPVHFQQLQYKEGLNENASFINSWGILDTAPIKPGEKSIQFTYEVPFSSSEHELSWLIYFNTMRITVFFESMGAQIKGNILSSYGIENRAKKKESHQPSTPEYYTNLTGTDIPHKSALSLQITNLPTKKIDLRLTTGFIFLLLCGVLIWTGRDSG